MHHWSRLKKTAIISAVVIAGLVGLGVSDRPKSNLTVQTNVPLSSQPASNTNLESQNTETTVTTKTPDNSDNTSSESSKNQNEASSTGVNDTDLSNNNTYTNVDGTTVHSPAESTDGAIPIGATAKCVDGTYSFSQHHSGTCSHHGGVAEWL